MTKKDMIETDIKTDLEDEKILLRTTMLDEIGICTVNTKNKKITRCVYVANKDELRKLINELQRLL